MSPSDGCDPSHPDATHVEEGGVDGGVLSDGTENGAQEQQSCNILMIPHPALPHITPIVHLAQNLVSQGGITCTILSYDYFIDKVIKDELPDAIHLLGLIKNRTGFNVDPQGNAFTLDVEELRCTTRIYIEELLEKQAADTGEEANMMRANSWLADSSMPKRKLSQNGTPFGTREIGPFTSILKSLRGASGILINSSYEFESRAFDHLREMGWKNAKPVGPLLSSVHVSNVSFDNDIKYVDDECLQWLDEQPAKSVVYVNFGTTGFNMFTLQMIHELALGLEASYARFLWILRPPPGLKGDEVDELLPSGFEERVKGRALVSRGWAPQLKILEHPSTATFLMQCGWNSMQEAIVRGIPFIGWATYADQPYNALYPAEVVKNGLLLPQDDKVINRHDVEAAVRTMMFSEEGLVMRSNAEKMKTAAATAIKPGGLSHNNLVEFIDLIRSA